MKKFYSAMMIVGGVAALTFAQVPAASAADVFSFSFDTGNVAFAYTDGYWDHSHTWHNWSSNREAREYRARYSDHYKAKRHTRERNAGWRNDEDHDGIPNSVDRDRDGDGVPNRRDNAPDNSHHN